MAPTMVDLLRSLKEPVSNLTEVALIINKQLLQTEFKNKNMVYSPLSIHMVLSLIAAMDQCPKFLSFLKFKSIGDLNSLAYNLVNSVLTSDSTTERGPRINLANGLWFDKPLDHSYKQVVDNSYKAALNQVDFKTDPEKVRIAVNSWVEKETKGLITEILGIGSVTSRTKLIFANTLYFKATWNDAYFYESSTKEHDFHLMSGGSVKVPFMTSGGRHVIGSFDGFKVLKISYESNYRPPYFSMCWILPDARDGLPALVDKVCSEPGFLDRHLENCSSVQVRKFLIPKFKISSGFEASGVLDKLGLPVGSMTIFHESVIEVNENGTTAAAATAAILYCSMGDFGPPPKIEDFVADHPFMFLIREHFSGTVLFMGQVFNPLEG